MSRTLTADVFEGGTINAGLTDKSGVTGLTAWQPHTSRVAKLEEATRQNNRDLWFQDILTETPTEGRCTDRFVPRRSKLPVRLP